MFFNQSPWNFHDGILTKIVSNINIKNLTIFAKRYLGCLTGPGRVSADEYITVLKIQMEIFKDRRQVKIG